MGQVVAGIIPDIPTYDNALIGKINRGDAILGVSK
jgi:hypothetical protein